MSYSLDGKNWVDVDATLQMSFIHKWQLHLDITAVEEVERRLRDTADKHRGHRHDYRRAGHRLYVIESATSHHARD